MNLLDYIILIILIICSLIGYKKGLITTVVAFIGTILIIVLAFYLKNPISMFMYEHLPFLSIGGKFGGIKIINILIYEGISFIITLSILTGILSLILKITGIFTHLVNATVVLSFPSKILGALCGFVEGIIVSFLVILIISLISPLSSLYNRSNYADMLITKTPVLSSVVRDTYNSVSEIYMIAQNNQDIENKDAANLDGLRVLLKYEILSPDSAERLVDNGKLDINGVRDIIDKYRKEIEND